MEKLEHKMKKYMKDSLKVNTVVKKASKIKLNENKNLIIAEIDSWEQKRKKRREEKKKRQKAREEKKALTI